ncbi:MAG: mechanosensitive ion channel family protein [Fulvivirga sp.]
MFEQISKASNIVLSKVESWIVTLVEMLPNFIIAILVLILFYIISRVIRKVLGTVLHRVMTNESVVKLILACSSFVIIIIGLMVALGVLNLDKTVTSLLAGIGVVGLALGFAFQDAAANLISGVFMAVKSPIFVGDIIETNGIFGKIKEIGLRATTIYVPEGQDVVIPNRLVFQNLYRHYTINGERRVDLQCGISYGENLRQVKEIATEAIKKIPNLLDGKEVEFFYSNFGDSSINFVVRYWIKYNAHADFLNAQSEGVMFLKEAFDAKGITIPFPIRTLDFGIKGGTTLSQMIEKK